MGKDFVPDYHLSKLEGVWRDYGRRIQLTIGAHRRVEKKQTLEMERG